ncbi:MAG: putative lipid II flippase FtsW [Defluviitaleaceae bacterium]|nr:putative lipid II flippase FtsW [Defluviitaleaceae bacterium]
MDDRYGYDPQRARDTDDNSNPRERYSSRENRRVSAPGKTNIHIGSVDITLYLVVVILVLIGVVMVFSASYIMAANRVAFNNDAFYFLRRNGIFAILGFVIMNLLANVSYEYIRPFVFLIFFIAIGLLIAVMFIGVMSGGAVRWLPFPVIGRFQPSEVAKAALIFMIAYLVEQYPNALRTWKGLFIYAGIVAAMAGLVLYGGFSSALIVATIGFGMIFIASPHFWRFILAGGGLFAAVAGFLWWDNVFGGGFRGARVSVWREPFSDPTGMGFQIIQSLFAVASGGWFGEGIGQSRQASFIPEPHNDIIFAIIVEELGFIGAGMVLLLFGIFIWRGIIIALRARDTFSSMIAIGIVFAVAFQTVINVAVVTNTIPNTGVTLPFISYGGTSLIVSMALAGILLNISRYTKDRPTEAAVPRSARSKPRFGRGRSNRPVDSY